MAFVKAAGMDLLSRKGARDAADRDALRDMRNPVNAVAKWPGLRRVGVRIWEVVEQYMRAHPTVVRAVIRLMKDLAGSGTRMFKILPISW